VEAYNFVAFHSKINLRRKFKNKGCPLGSLLDLEKDFKENDSQYQGPRFEAGQPLTQEWLDQLQVFFVHQEGRLHRKYIYRILCMTEMVYRNDPSLLIDICVPPEAVINICGDIHGQLYDLIKILKLQGQPSPTNLYLFNGDIVDKGQCSIECMLLLFVYKLTYPHYVFINRGNHESALVNVRHGFQKEIFRKYPEDMFLFEFFGDIFRYIPVAHLINEKILVVHGGLPNIPTLTIEDIRRKKPPLEAHEDELVAGLLWSDPILKDGISPSTRGIGVFFGPDVTKNFLEKNGLKCIVRSHAEVKTGCGLSHQGCYTVFSAPFEERGITGGLIELKGESLELQGNVFTECCKDEAIALLEGRAEYKKRSDKPQLQRTTSMEDAIQ